MNAPVVLIVFNRPELTRRVFERVAAARPASIFLIADGPRTPEEAEKCAEVRSIVTAVDWQCEITTDFSPQNLGCRERIVSGLNTVFAKTDRAIILEDDCLPHPKFFEFCDTLLERFQNCDRILEIGGANYQRPEDQTGQGFYFSRYVHNNGWATWRRAWQLFDADIRAWPSLRSSNFLSSFCGPIDALYMTEIFDRIHARELTTSWDFQWQLAIWRHDGLSAVPNANLISNIGYGPDATHTNWRSDPLAELPLRDLTVIGESPPLLPNQYFDMLEMKRSANALTPKTLIDLLHGRLRRYIRGVLG